MSDQRRLVLVVGVGRSGTSLLAGILGQLGFHIPQPEVKADETNPRGFGEPRWVVDFHRRLMRERRVTVFDARPAAWESTGAAAADPAVSRELREWLEGQVGGADAVVVKDPRIGWFLPLWMACARELGVATSFVTMLRHPAEILSSARRWYGTWQTDASRAASWLNMMLETERATRGAERAFVGYEALLADWAGEVRRLGALLELPALSDLDRASFPEVDAFVDPTLHRSRVCWDDLEVPARVRDMAEQVWATFQPLGGSDGAGASVALDDARAAYAALYGEAEAIAQSSVTAVKPRRGAARAAAAKAEPGRAVKWRDAVNQVMSRTTGYKLVKADRLVARPRPAPTPAPKRAVPRDFDDEARRIIETVRPRTMTAPEKLFGLIQATRYVVDRDVDGAIVECGVWRGGSMQAVAHALLARGIADRDLHLFDTFEGMPEPTERDRRHDGTPAAALLERSEKTAKVWAIASLEDVQTGMAETGYPAERIHLHRGLVEETIPENAPERIAILRLDTDWYESTRHELEHLYDRVPSGGVIIFDDYGFWEGAREAVDEFFGRTGERLLLVPIASGRIAVKP